jgi:hypothetical protein
VFDETFGIFALLFDNRFGLEGLHTAAAAVTTSVVTTVTAVVVVFTP